MNMNGWDTTSIVSIDLINHALEENADKLVSRFKYKDGQISVQGTFGPWKIVSGGSLQKLHVEIPIIDGTINGVVRRRRTQLAGATLTVEIGLRLLPRANSKDTLDLMFDLDGDEAANAKPITAVDITCSDSRLLPEQLQAIRLTLTDCLNAHADQVAFVFATVKSRGTATDAWLQMPHNDFSYVEAQGGQRYLVLMGAAAKPTAAMTPDRFDVKLLDGGAPANFAISHSLYLKGLLLPWLAGNFKPRGKFGYGSITLPGNKKKVQGVALQSPIALPKKDGYQPVLKTLLFTVQGNALKVSVAAEVHVAVGCYLRVTLDMTMPMKLDAKSGGVSISSDPHPKEHHWFDANNPLGWIVAAGATIVEWLIPALRQQITGTVTGIARFMQGKNNPLQQPKTWIGVRDFRPSRFKVSPCIWFADTRPVAPLTFSRPDIPAEPAEAST